jgi:hypothetical protein
VHEPDPRFPRDVHKPELGDLGLPRWWDHRGGQCGDHRRRRRRFAPYDHPRHSSQPDQPQQHAGRPAEGAADHLVVVMRHLIRIVRRRRGGFWIWDFGWVIRPFILSYRRRSGPRSRATTRIRQGAARNRSRGPAPKSVDSLSGMWQSAQLDMAFSPNTATNPSTAISRIRNRGPTARTYFRRAGVRSGDEFASDMFCSGSRSGCRHAPVARAPDPGWLWGGHIIRILSRTNGCVPNPQVPEVNRPRSGVNNAFPRPLYPAHLPRPCSLDSNSTVRIRTHHFGASTKPGSP